MSSVKKIEDFLYYLDGERRMSPNSIESYRIDLNNWVKAGIDLESCPDAVRINECLKFFEDKGLSRSTEARHRSTLRHYARFRSYVDESWEQLLLDLPSGRADESPTKALSLKELIQLFDYLAEKTDKNSMRNRALLELIYASGLRVSEALDLQWSQIDWRQASLRIIGKGNKERLIPTSERALDILQIYKNSCWKTWSEGLSEKQKSTVFISSRKKPMTRMAVWKIIRRLGLILGIDDLHPHVLRHSFATHLLAGGADLRYVQAILGHSTVNSTQRYLKIYDEELHKIFAEIHPLG